MTYTLSELFYGLFDLAAGVIKIFLIPIDTVISTFLPDLSEALNAVSDLFNNYIAGGIAWAVSLTGLSRASFVLIIAYFTFKLTVPVLFYLIKLVIHWYDRLKV